MKKRKSTYTPMPSIAEEVELRYRLTLRVLSGALTVSEAARQLGLSRNTFQSLMHRGLLGLVDGLGPKLPGRPSRPEEEKKLKERLEALEQENRELHEELQMMQRLMGAASELIKARRSPRTPKSRPQKTDKTDDEEPHRALARVRELRSTGVRATAAALLVGKSVATLRRYAAYERRGRPLARRRGWAQARSPGSVTRAAVAAHVRATRGLAGAESLRRTVTGTSRRQCAAIKSATLAELERERVASAQRVLVRAPGVIRGFDQLYVRTSRAMRILLVSADAAVPFRTSVAATDRYDEVSVARALAADIEANGPPLVYRLDRARQHGAPNVRRLLDHHGVLVLHGPPRCPRFYGQLERQNREHRAWLDSLGPLRDEALADEAERMVDALNSLWKRRTLDWCTAHDVYARRAPLNVDRQELRQEVTERAASIRRQLDVRGKPADLAERLAIEAALTQRGFLQRVVGGWC